MNISLPTTLPTSIKTNEHVEKNSEEFLKTLDYKKQAMYRLLPDDQKKIIKDLPTAKHKKRMIALLSYEQRNTTARQKWIDGLYHMREMTKDSGYFLNLICKLDRQGVDDIIDIYLNFEQGEYDTEKTQIPPCIPYCQKV